MPLNAFWGFEMAKKGFFYSIFVVTDEKFWILKFGVLAFFEAKINKIDILNLKLIVPNDYQQFWIYFEWFLSLFHISNVKW